MEFIRYNTTLKASGKEYTKIVFWNRFLRNPAELILSWLPAVISIVLICMKMFNTYLAFFYAASFCYPLYIFLIQFKNSVNYHLKHRDPSESAPCTMTLTEKSIMAEIPEYELIHTYDWNEFTTAYDKYGYYMLFKENKMIVMLRKADMSPEQLAEAPAYIKRNLNLNKCRVLF